MIEYYVSIYKDGRHKKLAQSIKFSPNIYQIPEESFLVGLTNNSPLEIGWSPHYVL